MVSLEQTEAMRDNHLKITIDSRPEVNFYEWLGRHPTVYDSFNLDRATVEYVNRYFAMYKVNPQVFEFNFQKTLMRVVPVYNNLKQIELTEDVFSTITKKHVRDIVSETSDALARNTSNSMNRGTEGTQKTVDDGTEKETGTVKDNGTSKTDTTSNTTTSNNGDTRGASRQLPMKSTGADFDDTVSWEGGASTISESKVEESGTEKVTSNSTTTTDNTQTTDMTTKNDNTQNVTISNTVKQSDIGELRDVSNGTGKENLAESETDGLIAEITERIWNYLVSPKAIDFLVNELKVNFILVL